MSRTFDYDTHTLKFANRKPTLKRKLDDRWQNVDYEAANMWYTTGIGDFAKWYREYGSPKKKMPRRPRGSTAELDLFSTPSPRSRTVGRTPGSSNLSTLGRYASEYLTPQNIRMAANIIKDAHQAYKNRGTSKTPSSTRTKKMEKRAAKGLLKAYANTSTGVYAGRFKKPTKKGAKTLENYLTSKGYHNTVEVYGDISDDHCVYIGHSTYNQNQIASTMAGAFFRKLLNKAGITIANINENIDFNRVSAGGSFTEGWRIVYREINPVNGDIFESTYTTIANETLKTLIGHHPLAANFESNMRAVGVYDPYELALYCPDRYNNDGTSEYRLVSLMNIQDEVVSVYCMSTMILQNRTKGANSAAGEFDAERVDNQPLRGYLYEFKSGEPRVKGLLGQIPAGGDRESTINRIRADALVFAKPPGGGQLPVEFEEPPAPGKFSNIAKASKIVLQPGQMKKGVITHKYSGKLITILKKLRNKNVGAIGGVAYVSGVPGKCQLFSVEEYIRTDSTNLITLNWEKELKVGVVLKSRKKQQLLSQLLSYSVSTA